MSLPSTLVDLRARARLSQRAVAAALGVSNTHVARWESGVYRPPYRRLHQLADVLGVDVGVLVKAAQRGR